MSIGARSFASSKAGLRGVAIAPVSSKSSMHMLPGNQKLLRRGAAAPTLIQAKLRLSQESDPAERQADEVAQQIVTNRSAFHPIDAVPRQMNLMCADCEEEIAPQVDPDEGPNAEPLPIVEEEDEDDETGMPKRDGRKSATVSEAVIPRGSGNPLPGDVLSRMEDGFGASLGQARIHTDAESARTASQVGALAFTVANDVYFGEGQYMPGTPSGERLLAHELTHVLQQQGDARTVSRKESNKKKGGGSVCSAGNCPQGKQSKAVTGDCGTSGPADPNQFIEHLEVSISGHTVVATWSDGSKNTWPCSPNPTKTPTGTDIVGDKCGINHTNRKKDGMAWFTGFDSQGHRIGFHDSQSVGAGFKSHGCVRVCCDVAKLINKNTWSGTTQIKVS